MPANSLGKTSSIFVVLVLFGQFVQAQLVANFSANPLSGCAPLFVSFTDLSTGGPTQWKWDLGNGTISFEKNPSVTYFNPGQYTVKLDVQNASGTATITKTQFITVYAQPTVNFSASTTTGCSPLPVQFTDMSTPGSGTIIKWEWDFGDGNSSSLQSPAHTYTSNGNYNVSLRITNSNGCFKTITRLQYVIINGVNADFSNSLPNSCTPPVNINFINLSTGSGTLSYLWDFGDGTTSALPTPSHIYNNPGSYTVKLTVSNSTGCSNTKVKANAITIGSVSANFTSPNNICANKPVTFSNISVPVPVSALWNFGDGTTSTLLNPVKTYTSPGVYQVKLVSNFGACKDSVLKTITVLPKPLSAFSGNPVAGCQAPLTVNFNNTSSNAASSVWDFGDGGISTQTNPSHTYTNNGTYTVTLISTNAAGCSDTLIRPQYIKLALPEVTMNMTPALGCSPLTVSFSSTTNSPDPVTAYLWDFGDGTTSTEINPTHIFATGVYDIKLTITTASGCTNTIIDTAGVAAGIKPVANFSANPLNVCAEIPIDFTDLSTGVIDLWNWDFGDGGSSELQNPTYIYTDTGYFDVQLTVSYNGCIDVIKFTKYIYIDPPVAAFIYTFDCNSGGKRIFTDNSIGADTWSWNFGDGTTSTIQHPIHTYTSPGTYTVSLTVTNNKTGCEYTKTEEVLVFIAAADFNAADTVICRNTTAIFNLTSTNANIISFEWTFGDGGTDTGNAVIHKYIASGLYDVSLTTTDINGCRDTILKQDYIRVNGPTANFGVQNSTTCSINAVVFTDSSKSDGINPITSWTWNYGDGVIETLNSGPFQHTYSSPGIYPVSLIVTDTQSCADTIVKASLLTISQPIADFITADTVKCPGKLVAFSNLSSGSGKYLWDFGDGITDTVTNPSHSYSKDGLYTVKLTITDQLGCSDTLIKVNYIRVTTPLANFSVSDTLGTCPPLIVNFTNNSSNYTSLNWDFGDGTSSQSANPSHFYSAPGTYIASLTVDGPGICPSVKIQKIIVRGPEGSFTYGPLEECNNITVNFVASTKDRVSFIWDFNDGNTINTTDSLVSHTYNTIGFYIPKMILLDAGGCVVPITGLDTIKVRGATASFDFVTQNLCNYGSVQFNNTTISSDSIISYRWDFGDGNSSSLKDPIHYYDTAGLYFPRLIVTTLIGCSDSMTSLTPVSVVTTPQGKISQSQNGCAPLTVSFNGSIANTDTSALSWKWIFGNGKSSTLKDPLPEIYTVAGKYPITMYVTNSSGCIDTVTSTVSAFLVPTVSAGSDAVVCQGVSTTLNASGASTYIWSPSTGLNCYDCPNPVATPDSITKYIVTGTTAEGCSNTDSVVVNVKLPFNMLDSGPDTLCLGSSVKLLATGAFSYSWSPAAGLNSTTISNPVASPSTTTTYQVVGNDDRNCFTDTAFIPVTVYPIPTVEAGPDVTIGIGEMIDLVPVLSPDVTNVIWSPTGSIFRNNYPAITVKPRETTTYNIRVTNRGGCISTDNLTVYVICYDANVFIPNTFSPNNDGANDVFYPRGRGLFKVKTARVYNRWGEIVYERNNFQANDISAGWDGTHKGVKLNPDVYVYIIEILCENNTTLPFKGNVALIR